MSPPLTDKIQAGFLSRPESENHQKSLSAIHPALQLKISKRARRIALRLDSSTRTMHLIVPPRFSFKKALNFAWSHQAWIASKIAALPAPQPFIDGAVIPVLGRSRVIKISYDSALKFTDMSLAEKEILISTNQPDPTPRLIRFLKNEARDTLTGLAMEKASQIEKDIREVQIRDPKSRWGSCGPDGRISFSWRLVFAPWEAMDYVVAHEVAHLVHMNHSKRFWALCEKLSEDYAAGKSWMRNHGHELMRYG